MARAHAAQLIPVTGSETLDAGGLDSAVVTDPLVHLTARLVFLDARRPRDYCTGQKTPTFVEDVLCVD
jgi:hypothetical protein